MLFAIEDFMRDMKLSSGALLVYASIYFKDKEGVVEEWYKDTCAGSSATVRRLLKELIDRGLVLADEDKEGNTIYYCKRHRETQEEPSVSSDSVYSENGKINPKTLLFKSQGRTSF